MNGYCVKYKDPCGVVDVSFFTAVGSDKPMPCADDFEIVRCLFLSAHSGCKVLDIVVCTLSQFQRIAQKYGA